MTIAHNSMTLNNNARSMRAKGGGDPDAGVAAGILEEAAGLLADRSEFVIMPKDFPHDWERFSPSAWREYANAIRAFVENHLERQSNANKALDGMNFWHAEYGQPQMEGAAFHFAEFQRIITEHGGSILTDSHADETRPFELYVTLTNAENLFLRVAFPLKEFANRAENAYVIQTGLPLLGVTRNFPFEM